MTGGRLLGGLTMNVQILGAVFSRKSAGLIICNTAASTDENTLTVVITLPDGMVVVPQIVNQTTPGYWGCSYFSIEATAHGCVSGAHVKIKASVPSGAYDEVDMVLAPLGSGVSAFV